MECYGREDHNSSSALLKITSGSEEGCWPDPGCRKIISKGSHSLIALEAETIRALTHIPKRGRILPTRRYVC